MIAGFALALIGHGVIRSLGDERARRLEVLMGIFGMWKGRQDLPQDGLAYQLEIPAEWD
ncbi:hypothetical protein [Massilia mucilaginosa]|uniref:hypothetical protein n=1 Tax=Massilia mucilaginosa TaxID=2609282 RepID=UPI00141DA4EB|nr:hypothetical protein [Massilia mucilaginosa]